MTHVKYFIYSFELFNDPVNYICQKWQIIVLQLVMTSCHTCQSAEQRLTLKFTCAAAAFDCLAAPVKSDSCWFCLRSVISDTNNFFFVYLRNKGSSALRSPTLHLSNMRQGVPKTNRFTKSRAESTWRAY